jgi:flagellar biosynthesis regulator FlbT
MSKDVVEEIRQKIEESIYFLNQLKDKAEDMTEEQKEFFRKTIEILFELGKCEEMLERLSSSSNLDKIHTDNIAKYRIELDILMARFIC